MPSTRRQSSGAGLIQPHGKSYTAAWSTTALSIRVTGCGLLPNAAQVLFLGDGAESDGGGAFATVCDLFDGNDPEAVQAARGRWKRFRDAGGHTLVYYQQDEAGVWSEKQRVGG